MSDQPNPDTPTEVHLRPDERHVAAHCEGVALAPWLHQCWFDPSGARALFLFTPDQGQSAGFILDHQPGRDDRWSMSDHPLDTISEFRSAGMRLLADGTFTGAQPAPAVPSTDPLRGGSDQLPWVFAAAAELIPWMHRQLTGGQEQGTEPDG